MARRNYLAVMVVAALLAFSATSEADERFTLRSLRGSWGFSAAGFLLANTPTPLPASAVGLITFDGVGGCVDEARLNAGGTVVALTSDSCSYTVNSDGRGTLIVTFLPAGAFTTDFVLVDNAEEFHFIVSDTAQPGATVASGVAKRQVR